MSQQDLRDKAEALAMGLELRSVSVDVAVSWADGVIEAEAAPHWSFCEVATMGRRYPPDLAAALRRVPGTPDMVAAKALVVDALERSLAEDRSRADAIACALFNLALAEQLPDPALSAVAHWAWDALALADDGVLDKTRAQVIDEVSEALRRASQNRSGRSE